MVVSDQHKFCFLHIPKCGGVTIRNALYPYDVYKNYFFYRRELQQGITIDLAHLTPYFLQLYFPEKFETVKSYTKFCLVRNPRSRFVSSFKQFLDTNHKYGGDKTRFRDISTREMQYELEGVIDALTRGVEMNPHYVHFTRQSDFVYYQGERFVDRAYLLENIGDFYRDIENIVGENLKSEERKSRGSRDNASFVYKNELMRQVLNRIRPYVAKYLPVKVKQAVQPLVFTSPSDRRFGIFESEYVRDFVQSFYRDDIRLYEDMRAKL